jgi:hypothetical protein
MLEDFTMKQFTRPTGRGTLRSAVIGVAAGRWPVKETAPDRSHAAQLARNVVVGAPPIEASR